MFDVISIEIVPDEVIKENDQVSFRCGIAGRVVDGIIQGITCMDTAIKLDISCDVHETDHNCDVDDIIENQTQGWQV